MKSDVKFPPLGKGLSGGIPAVVCFLALFAGAVQAERAAADTAGTVLVGVGRVDITPEGPIRLGGYGSRETESEGVLGRLWAKALAFGSDGQKPSVLITVDLVGIPAFITEQLLQRLSEKAGLDESGLVICASHTHGGPELGHLLNNFGKPLPPEQLGKLIRYRDFLLDQLEKAALMALENRQPSLLSWGIGEVPLAKNRRLVKNGKWVNFGYDPDGVVDRSFPLLRIADASGRLRAVLVNYACHGTSLGDLNQVHGDWIGEAQAGMESRFPGITAMVAIGCAGDASPNPDVEKKREHAGQYGQMIADEAVRLLSQPLQRLSGPPSGKFRRIELPYAYVPGVGSLEEQARGGSFRGAYSRRALMRLASGEKIPAAQPYPITVWSFGDGLAMVFLAGEVVADYALRLKGELGASRLWINAYTNDVPSYIPSKRLLKEGGFEVETAQYIYDRPAPYAVEIEDLIIDTVYELLPVSFVNKNSVNKNNR